MDKLQLLLLDTVSCALKKESLAASPGLTGEEWDRFFRLAQEHKLFPMVFEAVCTLPDVRSLPQYPQWKRHAVGQVMLQTRKTAEFRRVLSALTDAGLTPLVVKGIVCRSLYPLPDHRPSSDEDLLIPPEQFSACHRILTGLGLVPGGDPASDAYEIPYRQKDGPLFIELHRSLFPPESRAYGSLNRFFADAHSRAVTVNGVPTLEDTDHLFYLICHAYKHFLHSGFGLRQVCDILLFADASRRNIQWELLLRSCRSIRAENFAAAIFAIGRKHLGFATPFPLFREIPVDEMPMLLDLLDAGIYGGATGNRLHSSTVTLEAAAGGSAKGTSLLASVFPSAKTLEGRYPYLKQAPWLLPAAWTSRITGYLKESRTHNSPTEALKLGKERVELLRFYHIL